MLSKMVTLFHTMVTLLFMLHSAQAFSVRRENLVPGSQMASIGRQVSSMRSRIVYQNSVSDPMRYPSKRLATTVLSMYNLPPGRNDNELGDILKGAATLLLVVAFFASPLGGFVLGIFNSFILLALLLPVAGTIGVSVWQYFNTITGTCPNCGAPARVLKTDKSGVAQPSVCFSCGSVLQARYDNSGIDNITGRNTVNDLSGTPFGGTIFDVLGGPSVTRRTTATIYEEEKKKKPQKEKFRRENTIIDVEIDDEPWQ